MSASDAASSLSFIAYILRVTLEQNRLNILHGGTIASMGLFSCICMRCLAEVHCSGFRRLSRRCIQGPLCYRSFDRSIRHVYFPEILLTDAD